MQRLSLRAALLASALFAAAAHASPQDELAASQAAIINALVAGAGAHAPAELDRAREALQLARDSMTRKDYPRARQLAERAATDAAAAERKSRLVRAAAR